MLQCRIECRKQPCRRWKAIPHHSRNRCIQKLTPKSSERAGFSLVELIAVIVILAMLAGIVAVKTRTYLVTSKQNGAKVEIRKICDALETFYAAHDRYPTSEEGLEILVTGTSRLRGGVLDKIPLDPWKRSYQYIQPGVNGPYAVISLGADGREGGTDDAMDISNEATEEAG